MNDNKQENPQGQEPDESWDETVVRYGKTTFVDMVTMRGVSPHVAGVAGLVIGSVLGSQWEFNNEAKAETTETVDVTSQCISDAVAAENTENYKADYPLSDGKTATCNVSTDEIGRVQLTLDMP